MVSALFWCSGFHDQFYSAFQCRYPFQRHDTGGGALDEYPHLARHERRLSTTAFLSFSFETPFFLIEFALHLLPFFFFSCGTIVGQARSWDARVPRSFSLISFVPDCNHNNDGLVSRCRAARTVQDLGQLRLSIRAVSGPRHQDAAPVELRRLARLWRRVYCVYIIRKRKVTTARRKFGAFAFALCVWHYIFVLWSGCFFSRFYISSLGILGLGAILYTPNASALARQNVGFGNGSVLFISVIRGFFFFSPPLFLFSI